MREGNPASPPIWRAGEGSAREAMAEMRTPVAVVPTMTITAFLEP
jgi:hypothetical protein